MISSIIIGSFSKIINDFFETRKEKMMLQTREEIEFQKQQRLIELKEIEAKYNLQIEIKKTEQAEINAIIAEMDMIKNNISEIQNTDRVLYAKSSKWIIDIVASIKPIITFVIIMCYFGFYINVIINPQTSKVSMEVLKSSGLLDIMESVIGFWFGFASISTRKN